MTSKQFESMLQELKQNNEEENEHSGDHSDEVQNSELLTTTDMDFEMSQDDDVQEKGSNQSIEVEFVVHRTKTDRREDIVIPASGEDGLNFEY